MLKRTLACALFAITGHVYSADIQVTTLVDEGFVAQIDER